MIKAAAR